MVPFLDKFIRVKYASDYMWTGDKPGRFMDTLYANLNALTLQLEDKTTGNGLLPVNNRTDELRSQFGSF